MKEHKIIEFDELKKKYCKNILNSDERAMIEKAYEFAVIKYKGKKRKSGEDYIYHPIAVAYIVAGLNVDYVTIIGALLHETLNHTDTVYDEIVDNFSEEIAKIVKSISKINRLELSDNKQATTHNLRKILVGLSEDVRVLFIKLADRLHNMRTVWALDEEEQKHKARETTDVLIPIAHRLGINSIKSELEDLCLRYLKPDIYQDILDKLDNTREELDLLLLKMKESISDILDDHDIKFSIKGRVKSVHSIYNKLDKGKKFSDIYDVLALRVYLEKESDCYLAVGLIHSRFRPMPKRFKDYIAMPKSNMYQSLHTTIFGVEGNLFEIQLRTYEMDEIAEKGIASHWSYKEKSSATTKSMMDQKLEMYRNIIEVHNENESDAEFADNLHNELLNDFIYCFTPKGDVVELPKNSTPIDFAYRIHSKVGDSTIGAIVNDAIVPLSYSLQDGDVIKINTSSNGTPNKEWLKFVRTTQAKNKIKSYFSKIDKEMYILKGKELLEKEIRRQKLTISDVLSDDNISKVVKDLKLNDLDDLYLSVGSLRFTAVYIINVIFEDKKSVHDIFLDKMNNVNRSKNNAKNIVSVAGTDDILVTLANCCNPVLGDPIVGYVTKGQGVSVHHKNCKNISSCNDRIIDVVWNGNVDADYTACIEVEVYSDKNYLMEILNKATVKNIHIDSFSTRVVDYKTIYNFCIKINGLDKLNSFILSLQQESFIVDVRRINR